MTEHKIIFGDSRSLNQIKDKSVQLIITSPPYWQLKDYGTEDQIGFNDSYEEYINNLNLVWKECNRVLSDGCRLCINIGDQFARSVYYGRYKVIPIRTEIIRFCESLGMDYMGAIIWQKTTTMNTSGGGAIMGSFPYPRNGILKMDYEFILLFKKLGNAPKPTQQQKEQSAMTKEEWSQYFSSHWNFNGVKQLEHMFYDSVLIDEFQDFREFDYELIMKLAKHLNDILLVGDFYQHSVSARNNTGKPFKTSKGDVSYAEFVEGVLRSGFDVDTTTLSKSRRCSVDVCNYVSNKLEIDITSAGDHIGQVIWADDIADEVLSNDLITKLVYSEAARYLFSALNWSYAKGDTVDCACIILTKDFEKLAEDKFSTKKISISTLNKLYVAMTRSRGDLYLIKASTFKKLQNAYIKSRYT